MATNKPKKMWGTEKIEQGNHNAQTLQQTSGAESYKGILVVGPCQAMAWRCMAVLQHCSVTATSFWDTLLVFQSMEKFVTRGGESGPARGRVSPPTRPVTVPARRQYKGFSLPPS